MILVSCSLQGRIVPNCGWDLQPMSIMVYFLDFFSFCSFFVFLILFVVGVLVLACFLNHLRGVSRTLSNIQDGTFCENSYLLKASTISQKTPFDVWQGSEYASAFVHGKSFSRNISHWKPHYIYEPVMQKKKVDVMVPTKPFKWISENIDSVRFNRRNITYLFWNKKLYLVISSPTFVLSKKF